MNTAQLRWLLFLLVLGQYAFSQNYILGNDIPVTDGGRTLKAAWAGGLNAPQLSSLHLDGDGILDLLVYDRAGGAMLPFLNGGQAGQIDFHFHPEHISAFPALVSDWVLLRDFDGDGHADLFTAVPQVSNVRVYRNIGLGSGGVVSFTLFKDTVLTTYPPRLPLYSGKSDLPDIDDIDGDGDLDLLTFGLGANTIEWHKNLSVENTGGLLGMDFVRQSRCFGHFEEDIFGCTAEIGNVPCGTGERDGGGPAFPDDIQLHAGSSILSLDLDSNGLKDLVIGDIGCATLYGLYNAGTAQVAHFNLYEPDFPAAGMRAEVLLFPASFWLDIDNDGLKDLLVAPNKPDQAEDVRSIQFLQNQGTNARPDFQHVRYGVLQEEMIELGSISYPAFIDHNGDGLQDLIVGGAGRFDSLTGFTPRLILYENVGSAQSPVFDLVSGDYLDIANHPAFANLTHLRPTAADLDGDGDQDLLLGSSDGTLALFTNTAGPGNAATYILTTPNLGAIDVGLHSAPQLVDLDGDGDQDLLVGNHRGFIHYYDNAGSAFAASYVLVTDTFGLLKVNNFTGQTSSNGYAQPFACDHDGDGDLDLLVGGIEGELQVYPDLSLAPGAAFSRAADLGGLDFGYYASPAGAVLDSARLSFVVGNQRGGLMLLRDSGPLSRPETTVQDPIRLFPNPASGYVNYVVPASLCMTRYALTDLLGRELRTGALAGQEGTISLDGLANGPYLLCFEGRNARQVLRLQVMR